MSEQEARQRLARLAELGLITATLAHEQRQPLFAIKAIAQLLERQVDESAGALLSQLLGQVEHLERLVDGVGLYARAPDGEVQPLDLGSSVRAAVALMQHRGQRRGVTLSVDLATGLPAGKADATAVMQILVNLLQNALDASPKGAAVQVSAVRDGGQLVVHVRDQGEGISEGLRERVFEPFFTTKPAGQGTGLGLSISRELAAASGGELELLPADPGTRAVLTLPLWSP